MPLIASAGALRPGAADFPRILESERNRLKWGIDRAGPGGGFQP